MKLNWIERGNSFNYVWLKCVVFVKFIGVYVYVNIICIMEIGYFVCVCLKDVSVSFMYI